MARLFISQERLDSWSLADKVRLEGDTMTLAGDGRSFRLVPAVRFLSLVEGTEGNDAKKLIGHVKSEEQLAALGADHMMSSVLVGETAYNVQPGFVGIPLAAGAAQAAKDAGLLGDA